MGVLEASAIQAEVSGYAEEFESLPIVFGPFKILPHGERVSGGRLGLPEALVIPAKVCGYVEEFETIPMVFWPFQNPAADWVSGL